MLSHNLKSLLHEKLVRLISNNGPSDQTAISDLADQTK